MTLINDIERKCSVCGGISNQRVLLSTNAWGAPDLDLRPPSMQRETMDTWVQECPHCGYVSENIEKECEISKDFLKTEKYLTCDGIEFKGRLAPKFYRNYLISNELNNLHGCFNNLLYCAWDLDDAEDIENAVKVRKLALKYLDKISQDTPEKNNNNIILRADLLRRSGEFDRVIEEYMDMILGDELLDKIITFHVIKAREGDGGCYTVEDVK